MRAGAKRWSNVLVQTEQKGRRDKGLKRASGNYTRETNEGENNESGNKGEGGGGGTRFICASQKIRPKCC
jgi:hypothetical protein